MQVQLRDVQSVTGTGGAFAALRQDGLAILRISESSSNNIHTYHNSSNNSSNTRNTNSINNRNNRACNNKAFQFRTLG